MTQRLYKCVTFWVSFSPSVRQRRMSLKRKKMCPLLLPSQPLTRLLLQFRVAVWRAKGVEIHPHLFLAVRERSESRLRQKWVSRRCLQRHHLRPRKGGAPHLPIGTFPTRYDSDLWWRVIAPFILSSSDSCHQVLMLHEAIICLGYLTLGHSDNQTRLGVNGQSVTPLLLQLCQLPFNYFSQPVLADILFPTLIACCFPPKDAGGSSTSTALLAMHLNPALLANFLEVRFICLIYFIHFLLFVANVTNVFYKNARHCWRRTVKHLVSSIPPSV